MPRPTTRPITPKGLKRNGGAKLWRDIVEKYDLGPHELRVLENACREWDIIERLEEELDGAALIVAGSMGQPVANELLSEVRMHRAAFHAAIKALGLPEDDEGVAAATRSESARAAAHARWSGRRGTA